MGKITDLTLRDIEAVRSLATGQLHTFRVRPFQGKILEVEDIHFHHDSAVMLPDSGDIESIVDASDENHVSGLDVLRACYLHAERMPSNLAMMAGHTDRSGDAGYNQKLSQKRADNVFHLLMGNKDEWVAICHDKHEVEDIQQILIWVTATFAWPCDPGPKNNKKTAKTTTAIKSFQKTYNEQFSASIGVDGDVGKQTWGAFFDVYMMGLRLLVKTDDAGLAAMRARIKFVDDAKKTVGCGENFPITADLVANQKSQVDRRVHVLFFDPPDVPKLDCHPAAGECKPDLCELYGSKRIYTFKPLPKEPEKVARNFRLKLEYGEIDRLFTPIAKPDSTDMGIRERLEAAGFLYEMTTAGQIKKIAPAAWEHFKKVVEIADNAAAAEKLKAMLAEVILDDNTLPAPGEFGKIRLPGTWCMSNVDYDANYIINPATPAGVPHHRYSQENLVWSDNARLGLVPIVAIVEQETGGVWGPAPRGLKVHFQLITPDDVPAGTGPPALRATSVVSVNGTTTFTMTGSPNAYVDAERKRNAKTPDDPQVDNAHQKVGGKRGNPAAGNDRAKNVLQTGVTHKGFHDHFALQASQKSTHPHAVVSTTNDTGKAALILMPARTGGDRYRIRAFLDPIPEPGEDQPSDGTGELAVMAETGTLVVWRILRFSKYLRWDYPPAAVNPNDAVNRANARGALNDFDFPGVIATEYKKAWLDVEVEKLARTPQLISQAEWRAAIQFARGKISTGGLSQKYDLPALLPDTTSTAGVHNNNAGLIRYRTAAQYDAARGKGFPKAPAQAAYYSDMASLMQSLKIEIMEYFTQNALSGMTVIQVPLMTSIETDIGAAALQGQPSRNHWGRSGWGGFRRGCYVAYGQETYARPTFAYDHNRNTMHELGHTLYCTHQYETAGAVNTGKGGPTGAVADEHDYHDLCVMGYMNLRPGGDFCGRCLLLFAGWDTHGMPANSPGP
jgi:hypothetical protein